MFCCQESWLPELHRVVGLINESFSTNFAQIGCAGEVLLGQHEDYDQFSIQVSMKFSILFRMKFFSIDKALSHHHVGNICNTK
jgi:hypothetical protein